MLKKLLININDIGVCIPLPNDIHDLEQQAALTHPSLANQHFNEFFVDIGPNPIQINRPFHIVI